MNMNLLQITQAAGHSGLAFILGGAIGTWQSFIILSFFLLPGIAAAIIFPIIHMKKKKSEHKDE